MREYNLQDQNSPQPDPSQIQLSSTLPQDASSFSRSISSSLQPRAQYGNMVVLYTGKKGVVTLGPDYLCFLPTFVVFCLLAIALVLYIFGATDWDRWGWRCTTLLVSLSFCGSYLSVATSNPGMITPSSPTYRPLQSPSSSTSPSPSSSPSASASGCPSRQCKRCNHYTDRSAHHCWICDMCIAQYDHHCPWTSKCIGGGNLYRFYFFLASIPAFILYAFVAVGVFATERLVQELDKQGKTPLL